MARNSFDVSYLSPDDTVSVTRVLPAGYYFLFGVATAHYQKLYGKNSGPMGLVHGLIVEVRGDPKTRDVDDDVIVYHASTSAKRVMHEPFAKYAKKMKQKMHKGYAVY